MSDLMVLANMVFQGTVLGPPLWNVFFADVAPAARKTGGTENVFADDLNVFKRFNAAVANQAVVRDMHLCQENVHEWGRQNGVGFDPAKEHFLVLHHQSGEGEPFKMLGTKFDTKLVMEEAVASITKKSSPKLTALLRTKPYYDTVSLVQSCKAHILCLLEGSTGAIYHASDSVLAPLDGVQARLLRELELSVDSAFLDFNLAPLCLRRDIAMLGLLFKSVRGLAHPALCALFKKTTRAAHTRSTRTSEARHSEQLEDPLEHLRLDASRRSLLGLPRVFNLLPAEVVQQETTTAFQSALTRLAKRLCQRGYPDWPKRFSPRSPHHVLVAR